MAWEKVKLGDVCVSIADGDHLPPPKADCGIPFVTISNITSANQFDFTNTMFVPQEYYDSLDEKRKPKVNDILYSVVGSFGKPVFIKDDSPFVFQRHIAILRPDESKIYSRYLYYKMLSNDFYMMADAVAVGAAQRTVSLTALRNMKINIPNKETQKRIAAILSAYDDLIENNQKQIKLLEEAAQRLYKQWFIDLKFPGHETTKIVDGLPEGWEKEKIDAVYNIKYGKNLPKTEIKDVGKYPVYGANGIIGYYDSPNCFQKVVLITSRGNGSGDVGCTKHKESFVTNNSFIVLPNKSYNYYGFSFIYGQMNAMDFHSITTGSAQPQLTNNSISTLNVNVPPQELITNFSGIVDNYYEKIDILYNQMFCLQIARDRLLPKLMSDEIEV